VKQERKRLKVSEGKVEVLMGNATAGDKAQTDLAQQQRLTSRAAKRVAMQFDEEIKQDFACRETS